TGRYHLVAPLFPRARVWPLGGEPLTVTADGQAPDSPYVTSLTVRDRAHTAAWIDHADLHGRLHFTLAAEPGDWGEVPPSATPAGASPQALSDLLPTDPSDPLLDDDARTERTWPDAAAVVDLPPLSEPAEARFMT